LSRIYPASLQTFEKWPITHKHQTPTTSSFGLKKKSEAPRSSAGSRSSQKHWQQPTYTGTVIEVQRYINKPMRWHERPVCHELRELWVSNGSGDQRKWVIQSKLMARVVDEALNELELMLVVRPFTEHAAHQFTETRLRVLQLPAA
jgi:hypothetical protein